MSYRDIQNVTVVLGSVLFGVTLGAFMNVKDTSSPVSAAQMSGPSGSEAHVRYWISTDREHLRCQLSDLNALKEEHL